MSYIFNIYEEQLISLLKSVEHVNNNFLLKKKQYLIEAEKMLNMMELDMTLGRDNHKIKIKNYKEKVLQLWKDLENKELPIKLNSLETQDKGQVGNDYNKLVEVTLQMNSKLEDSKRKMIEMDYVGNYIARDLSEQSDKISKINSKEGLLNDELTYSGTIITRMTKRENRNKMLFGIFSIGMICIVLFVIFLREGSEIPSSTTESNLISYADGKRFLKLNQD